MTESYKPGIVMDHYNGHATGVYDIKEEKTGFVLSRKRRLKGDLIASFTTEKELIEEMETDSSQMYTVKGQESTVTSCNKENSDQR